MPIFIGFSTLLVFDGLIMQYKFYFHQLNVKMKKREKKIGCF